MDGKFSRRRWLSGLAGGLLGLFFGKKAVEAAAPDPAKPADPPPPAYDPAAYSWPGTTSTYSYDSGGRVTTTTDFAGCVTTYAYDRHGDPLPGQQG